MQNLSMGNVVRNTSFSVYAGQITGMFGLIGSGRTETAKIIAGVYKRNFFHGGEIRLDGRPVRYRVPRPAVRDGIVYVTEDRKIEGFFETMSIAENLYERPAGGRPQPQRRSSAWRKCASSPSTGPRRSTSAPSTAMPA